MNLSTSFCMDVGQVKTGDDTDDTYVKMLQEVVRVTAPVAYGIAAKYPNVMSLVRGFKEEGPTALEDLKVSVLCHLRSPLILFGFVWPQREWWLIHLDCTEIRE